MSTVLLLLLLCLHLPTIVHSQMCGSQGGGAICSYNACCSQWGYCGNGESWCGAGCQSGPCDGTPATPPTPTVVTPVTLPPIAPPPTISPKPTPKPITQAPFDVNNCEAVKMQVNFGYYEEWAEYRNANCNRMTPGQIDVARFGYTHLAFSFAGISYSGRLEPYNSNTGYIPKYVQFNALKTANPELKTLIAVGGWNFDQTRFVTAASTAARRKVFGDSVVTFCEAHGFDGIDMDWEYPVTRQGSAADKANYPLLLEAMRKSFNDAGHGDWLITVATSISVDKINQGYDMVQMYPHIDWFNMMSYDIYGAWDTVVGANTDQAYIANTIQHILNIGIPPTKIVYGMAAYGRSMRLANPSCKIIGCPINGAGLTGCHGEAGNMPWFEIDESYIQTENYDELRYNEQTMSMEMISGGGLYFTSFDNSISFNAKWQFAESKCLRGIMWWAVDLIKDPISFFFSPIRQPHNIPCTVPNTNNEANPRTHHLECPHPSGPADARAYESSNHESHRHASVLVRIRMPPGPYGELCAARLHRLLHVRVGRSHGKFRLRYRDAVR